MIVIIIITKNTELTCTTFVPRSSPKSDKELLENFDSVSCLLFVIFLIVANNNIVVFQDYNEHFRDLNVSTSGFPELHRNNLEKNV